MKPRSLEEVLTMSDPVKLSVIYYSATGTIAEIAKTLAQEAEAAGAEVRLRRVAELAPESAIDSNPAWRANVEATKSIPEATPDDVVWADAVVFGSPTRFGNVSSQLKQFLDTLGGRWNISLFHYRNHGADFGRVLVGFEVPDDEEGPFNAFLERLGYPYQREIDNPAYRRFLTPGA